MSDLISRKDLLEIIAQTKRVVNSENQDYYKGYICALAGIEGVIAGQPTAYDVDKVLEELEEVYFWTPSTFIHMQILWIHKRNGRTSRNNKRWIR